MTRLWRRSEVAEIAGVVDDDEEDARSQFRSGLLRMRRGDGAGARAAFDRALELLPDLPGRRRRLRSDRDVDRLRFRRRVAPVLEEGCDRVRVVFVILEPLDEAPARLDAHLRGAGSGCQEPDRSGVVREATPEHELRDARAQLKHRADREVRIGPARDEVQESLGHRRSPQAGCPEGERRTVRRRRNGPGAHGNRAERTRTWPT